ncbi:MAG: DUF58 domain-containing protein [Planctomycetota bacterium]
MAAPAAPNYLDPQTLAAIGGIELRSRLIVEGLMSGQHRSPMQGVSVEFAQHRPYTPGDDLRSLDWKILGKTDRLYLKQTFKETNLDLLLLVDGSGSMGYTSLNNQPAGWTNHWTKWNHACCVAAAMANLALRQRDRVGLTVFADDVIDGTRLSNASDHWRAVAATLARVQLVDEANDGLVPEDGASNHTDLERIVDRTVNRLTRRSLIVLISDLFDDPEHLESALGRLRYFRGKGHDAVVLQVMDPAELDFSLRDPTDFIGLEGEGRLPLDPAGLREAYLGVVKEHLGAIEQTCRAFGFDYLLLNTRDALGPPLSHFLAKRTAMIGKR